MTQPDVLDAIAVLTPEDCARVCDRVYALRAHWTRRHESRPFFTLGTASYLDATGGRFVDYSAAAQRGNALLAAEFDWMYQRLDAALSAAGFAPIVTDERLARPGFHIFLGDNVPHAASASKHYDLQYEHIDWSPYARVDLQSPLSFTLTVRLPEGGSGLFVWHVDVHAVQQLPPDARRAVLHEHRHATYHPYEAGKMVLHNGHYLHQIARLSTLMPGDARITIQGHAVSTDRGWVVYW